MPVFPAILSAWLAGSSPATAQAAPDGVVAEEAPAQSASTLVVEGEQIGGFSVQRVVRHAEFQRYHFAGEDAPAPVELVEKPVGRSGVCADHGLTLFPRWELQGEVPEDPWIEGERDPQTAEERLHAALCARLHEQGAAVRLRRAPEREAPPPLEPGTRAEDARPLDRDANLSYLPVGDVPLSWLHLVLAPLVALGAGLGVREAARLDRPGRRDLFVVALLAVAVRLLLSPWTVFNGAFAGYEKIVYGWGYSGLPTLYGDGWGALMGPLHARVGLHPDVALTANLVLACLAPVALFAALRVLAGPGAARLGGLWLAVLPLAVALSATEVMTVPVVTLSLVALAAAARAGLAGGTAAGALAGLAAGFAVHVRPEALLLLPTVALAPVVTGGRRALGRAGPWLALLFGGAILGLRLLELPPPADAGPMRLSDLADPTWWVSSLLPSFGGGPSPHHIFLDLRWTSPVLWVAAGLGLRAGRRGLPFIVGIASTWLLLDKSWPLADALRLQLVAAPLWVGLAALGADRWLGSRRRLPWEAAAVAAVALHLATGRLDLGRHQEWPFLARAVPALPADSVLRYDDTPHRSHALGSVLLSLNPDLRVKGASDGPLVDGELMLRTVSCLAHPDEAEEHGRPPGCDRVQGACRLAPVSEQDVPAREDADSRFDPGDVHDGTVTIGIYRLEDCQ